MVKNADFVALIKISPDLNDVATLSTKVGELYRSNQQLQEEKKILEDEFGKKRAVFRELYMSREGMILVCLSKGGVCRQTV